MKSLEQQIKLNQTRLLDLVVELEDTQEIFSNLGIDVYGIDISPHMNVLAKKNCQKVNLKQVISLYHICSEIILLHILLVYTLQFIH